jgi:pre-60S factor REI1
MAKEHSFNIPDIEHVSDMEGLLKHLGVKLGAYHVCLWCSSKCYRDLLSVQKHMIDKGHQKMRFEGETLVEYADFYAYDDQEDLDEDYDIVNQSDIHNESRFSLVSNATDETSVFDENYELVLPSGARIGHRSLFKYYKQTFGHRSLELKQRNNISIKDKYRAIANNSDFNSEIFFVYLRCLS